jgi:radical SAM family RiPP maturation amino acid epimerase
MDNADIEAAVIMRVQALLNAGELKLVYLDKENHGASAQYVRELAEAKRLLERWSSDPAFARRLSEDTAGAMRELGLSLDSAGLDYLWDERQALGTRPEDITLPALRYRAFILEKLTHRNRIRAGGTDMDPRYTAWRGRQMQRADSELGPTIANGIVHAPFSIELSQGCSVGCWFCGIAAPKLEDIFLYTEQNARLFTGVMEVMKEVFGNGVGNGFCYWATDPMDNPDYEKFLVDFHGLTGVMPQTTTALALKDVGRTRRLLELSRRLGGMLERFSLLSLKQLERVHQEFTAEELLYVELVTQNREGHQAKARAGKALQGRRGKGNEGVTHEGDKVAEGTIACVSGFLVSMVSRTVKLISPCRASERWPLGYIVYGEGSFQDEEELRQEVRRLMEEHMHPLRGEDVVGLHEHLRFEELEGGMSVSSSYQRKQFVELPVMREVARALSRGRRRVEEVVQEVSEEDGMKAAEAMLALELMYSHGVLDASRPPVSR